MLPETDVARVRQWVDARNDRLRERARGQIRYELDVADRHVTIYECRPPWRPQHGPEWTRFPRRLHDLVGGPGHAVLALGGRSGDGAELADLMIRLREVTDSSPVFTTVIGLGTDVGPSQQLGHGR